MVNLHRVLSPLHQPWRPSDDYGALMSYKESASLSYLLETRHQEGCPLRRNVDIASLLQKQFKTRIVLSLPVYHNYRHH